MSSARNTESQAVAEPTQLDERAEHAANAQWLKDNPTAMPQVSAGRWAVYDRAGRLCGHLVGDGPTRETRFKAVMAENDSPGSAPGSYGITLHDAGAHLLDTAHAG
jgi:hypothetical protein